MMWNNHRNDSTVIECPASDLSTSSVGAAVGSEFAFVDTAIGGANRRNHIMRMKEFQPPRDAIDCFATFLRFTQDLVGYASSNERQGKPSVRGYPGAGWASFVPFDFDSQADPARAMADAAVLVRRLADLGVPTEALRLYFSGSKGIHVEVPASLFGGFAPDKGIASRLKTLVSRLVDGLDTADVAIYDKMRLWRVANTKHGKTGLFKIPITLDELQAGDLCAIQALAQAPRAMEQVCDEGWGVIPALESLALESLNQDSPRKAPTIFDRIPELLRNSTLISLAGSLRCRGLVEDEIAHLLLYVNAQRCDPPLDEDEVLTIARSAARYEASGELCPPKMVIDGQAAPSTGMTTLGAEDHLSTRAGRVRMCDVKPEVVSWLWKGRIPLGKLTVLDGDPGLAKSTITLDIAARVSRGWDMPDDSPSDLVGPAGGVLLSGEDGLGDTIRPRLEAAGADLTIIVAPTSVETSKGERDLMLDDRNQIREAIREVGAKLVVVDPLAAYVPGNVDMFKDQDMRRILRPLATLAEETGAAIVVVRHLTKATKVDNALYRGGGSMGIIGSARSGLLVAKDPQDPTGETRILASTKCNLAKTPASLAYRTEEAPNGAVRIAWEGETDHTADSLLSGTAAPPKKLSALEEAQEFLLEALGDGPRPSEDVKTQALFRGISEKTLLRAKESLGVEAEKEGFGKGGVWFWRLRDDAKMANESKDGQRDGVASNGTISNLCLLRSNPGLDANGLLGRNDRRLHDVCA